MKKKKKALCSGLKDKFCKVHGFLIAEYNKRSKYGFIYVFTSVFVKLLCVLNLVEWFKVLFVFICRLLNQNTIEKEAKNWAIDLFIVLKYLFLVLVISLPHNSLALTGVVYLLVMNLFTYFYHHVWKTPTDSCAHWQARRFVSLFLAIVFNVLCYFYLYWNGMSSLIRWNEGVPVSMARVAQFSLANTFMLPSLLSVENTLGLYLQTSQQMISWIFLVIILAQSIPQLKKEE